MGTHLNRLLGGVIVAVVMLVVGACGTSGTDVEASSSSIDDGVGVRTSCGHLAGDPNGHLVVAQGDVGCAQARSLMNRVLSAGPGQPRSTIGEWMCFVGGTTTVTSALCTHDASVVTLESAPR